MITNAGKTHIKRYLAGQVPSIARTLALGVGDTAATVLDQKLALEVLRVPINLPAYDPVTDRLIYKAAIPDTYIGKVYEIGLFSLESDTLNDPPNFIVSTFDQNGEIWSDGVWDATNTRVGIDSLRISAVASATVPTTLLQDMDLSRFSPSDAINLGYYSSANVAAITIRFHTDESNYFSSTISAPAAGYHIAQITKSSFAATGSPRWENITSIAIVVSATGAGTGVVDLDILSLVDLDFNNPELIMVARQVLSPVFDKQDNSINEIEFSLGVSVT